MKCDIILAGVGGQGVLSVAFVIGPCAVREGLHVKQCEIHGMAQRGAGVQAHLRIADRPIWSDLIPAGEADILLSMEPLECLPYLDHLAPDATVVTSSHPVRNFPAYPDLDRLLADLRSLPRIVLVDAIELAREAGASKAVNSVMVGAAAHLLPVSEAMLEDELRRTFAVKGDKVVEANVRAFRAGIEAMERQLAPRPAAKPSPEPCLSGC